MSRFILPMASLLLALTFGPAVASGPSFDCAKAGGKVETLICNDPALAALDLKLAAAYDRALERVARDGYSDPRAMQRGWVKGRNDCWKAEDVRDCVEAGYRQRIAELQIQYGDMVVPSPVNFRCGAMDLAAVFYQETDPPTVVLTPIDMPDAEQVIAFLERAASGARYQGRNVSFWEHHGEAALTWQGKDMTCRPLNPD